VPSVGRRAPSKRAAGRGFLFFAVHQTRSPFVCQYRRRVLPQQAGRRGLSPVQRGVRFYTR
jgi:hypothetical protein